MQTPTTFFTFLFFFLAAFPAPVLAKASSSRPNVLIMMADDLGRNDVGYYGNPEVSTPNIDALFRRGVVFDRLYVDSSCRPTRAALMSGLDPARLGFSTEGYGISQDVPTLPRLFSLAGYETAHIGKWHLGYLDFKARPNGIGFEYFYGFLDQGFLRGPQQEPPVYRRPPTYIDPWMMENNGAPVQVSGHLQDIITQNAIKQLKDTKLDSPWLLNVWFYAPHEPIEPARRYLGENSTPKEKYLASLKQLDDNVGEIIKALEQSGQAANTLVLFLSDNGGSNKYFDNNAPFVGAKTSFKEGGVRVPGVILGPGLRQVPSTYRQPVQHIDILPTLLEASLIDTRSLRFDGQSHWQALSNGMSVPARPFFWNRESVFGNEFGVLSADGRFLLSRTFMADDALWLQDLSSPASAQRNLIEAPEVTGVKQELLHLVDAWRQDRGEPRLVSTRVDDKTVQLSGNDFLRTPGTGKNSFGFALQGDWRQVQRKLAEQPGVWNLRARKGHFEYNWRGLTLTTPIPKHDKCYSLLAYTVATLPSILSPLHSVEAKLFVNGKEVASKRVDGSSFLPTDFPPTRIALDNVPQKDAPAVVNWTARNDTLFVNGHPLDNQLEKVSRHLCGEN